MTDYIGDSIMGSMSLNEDEFFMELALKLAKFGKGFTSPNPMVGAVIVKNGRIVGTGYHKRKGEPHAEVRAIEDAGEFSREATMYVNLEPCNIYGATPPCTEAIKKAGIKKVVISMRDPNPKVNGRGVKELKSAGIEVVEGILEEDAKELNKEYITWMKEGRPYVYLKLALTLDGFIADYEGNSKWISGEEERKVVHRIRGEVDAILVGASTVMMDDPLLTPRDVFAPKMPLRVVIDGKLKLTPDKNIFKTPPETLLVTESDDRKLIEFEKKGVKILKMKKINIGELLNYLGSKNILSLLVEGGALTASKFLESGYADSILLFYAPKILGGGVSAFQHIGKLKLANALSFNIKSVKKVGEGFLVEIKGVGKNE